MQAVSQVAAGIYQVPLPLPFALNSVNCYLLEDTRSWTLVDTGLNYAAGRETWQSAFAALGITAASIQRIILTHAHPDHYGMAGWLAAQSGAPVFLAAEEQQFARRMWREDGAHDPAFIRFFQDHGMPGELGAQVQQAMGDFPRLTAPHPETQLIDPNHVFTIGTRRFQFMSTPGHSDGHMILLCAEEKLILCGDAVLGKITPNVGVWPYSRPNPLADFLRSLEQLAQLAITLALPGHGPLITEWQPRIEQLTAHHAKRLQQIEDAVGPGATAFAICTSVFPVARYSIHEIRFAVAETLAHLEYLVALGHLERVRQDTILYQRI